MHKSMNKVSSERTLLNIRYYNKYRKSQRGALLLTLIITMVILSVLGGAMVYIFSSSTLNTISGNYAKRAYYNAEAGFRYVTALYRVAGNKNVFQDYANPQTLTMPDGGTAKVTVSGLTETYVPATANYASGSGNTLVLSPVSGTFPDAPGFFVKDGNTAVFRYTGKRNDGDGNMVLSGITPVITAVTGDTFTSKEQATIVSVGTFGSGLWNVSRSITYTWPLSNSGEGGPSGFDEEDFTGGKKSSFTADTMTGNTFDTTKGISAVTTETYANPQGGTYERTDLVVSGTQCLDKRTNNEVCYSYTPFKYEPAKLGMVRAWELNDQMLSYDIQIKTGTGPALKYAGMGFIFRAREKGEGQNIYYTGYGISFMRYKDNTYRNIDFIPVDVKPTTDGGNTQSNRLLLVLWKQDGEKTWKWLAYKKLHLLSPGTIWDIWNRRTTSEDEDGDVYVRGSQYEGDGYFINDDSTVMIRVIEKMVDGSRTNDIQLFFGDAGWYYPQNTRTQDTSSYNVENYRFGYHRNLFISTEVPWRWPSLPDISSSYWVPTANDWFTAVQWDRVNPGTGAEMRADKSGNNSIIRDNSYTSEDFKNNPNESPEIVFHTFGDVSEDRWNVYNDCTVHFTDLAIRLLKSGDGGGQSWIGAIQQ